MDDVENHPAERSDGRGLALEVDPWGRLVLKTPDGRTFNGVEPVRAFPMTDPDHWVSFCDDRGHEVLSLRSLDGLAPEVLDLLRAELDQREFIPTIRRIVRVHGESTPSDWEVETDRGPTRFTLDGEDDVRLLGPRRVLITDARKLRYQIPDVNALDGPSRRNLERFL